MSALHGWRRGSLSAVLIVGPIGCAARGRAMAPEHPDAGPAIQVVSVVAGEGRGREIRGREDGTLSSLPALVRVLRASDRVEIGTRVVAHEPAGRASWCSTLDPALTGLATAIVQRLGPVQIADGGRP